MARVLGLETRSAKEGRALACRSMARAWEAVCIWAWRARSCFPAAMDTAASLGHQLTRWSTSSG